jgi:hypothetical protein
VGLSNTAHSLELASRLAPAGSRLTKDGGTDWAAAPVAGTVVELWGMLVDVDGSDDDTQTPATTVNGGARYFGAFIMSADDALQRRTITISLLGVQKCAFYFKNGTAQNMNNDGGTNAVVKITPFVIGAVTA